MELDKKPGGKKKEKWTEKQREEHMKVNVKDYGAAVVCAALYLKLYGKLPKIGLSGFQAEGAKGLQEVL